MGIEMVEIVTLIGTSEVEITVELDETIVEMPVL
jgi:hypothetical protein